MERNEYIKAAVEHYESLLKAQLERQDRMANDSGKTDFASKETIVVGFIDGDGIGPIIMAETKRILQLLLADELKSGKLVFKTIEGLTIERRMALGKTIPDDVLEEIKSCDVLLKGPTQTPNGGTMESANVTLRRELDLFANIRPVQIPEEGIDWIFFRENTEGEYALGSKGIEIPGSLAMDFKVTTYAGTERIARQAFEYARANGKTNLNIITKANIMKKTDGLFSQICHDIAKEYPEISVDEYYIDIMTANLLNKDIRSSFQVFLLPNLYGDIITDEAAQIQGGVGTAGSANIGNKYAMFEAIHGSAPRLIELGLGKYASPASLLKASELMLRHIGLVDKANALGKALDECSKEKKVVADGTDKNSTAQEFADYVISKL